jgi:hypothetical protein
MGNPESNWLCCLAVSVASTAVGNPESTWRCCLAVSVASTAVATALLDGDAEQAARNKHNKDNRKKTLMTTSYIHYTGDIKKSRSWEDDRPGWKLKNCLGLKRVIS